MYPPRRLDAHTVRLVLRRSLDTHLPGVHFSPLVEAINNKDGLDMKVCRRCMAHGGPGAAPASAVHSRPPRMWRVAVMWVRAACDDGGHMGVTMMVVIVMVMTVMVMMPVIMVMITVLMAAVMVMMMTVTGAVMGAVILLAVIMMAMMMMMTVTTMLLLLLLLLMMMMMMMTMAMLLLLLLLLLHCVQGVPVTVALGPAEPAASPSDTAAHTECHKVQQCTITSGQSGTHVGAMCCGRAHQLAHAWAVRKKEGSVRRGGGCVRACVHARRHQSPYPKQD